MADQTVHITVDETGVDVPAGTLLWEAAHEVDIDIPIFCYHSKLGPVGVCRMCMVEVEGMPKLTTACTTAATEGMVVHTKSPSVQKAQQGVLEFLLINHPLDCPICDRAGECPLQDQTFHYGPGVSRFVERKRHFLKPIHLGPTIDLDRERCILCWRCVRFTSEVVEDDQLILVDRGSETFIGTYESKPYDSYFSGNVIELCPVGALTSRRQRFTFRPWELKEHSSICPHCPMGCNIHIDVRDAQEVIRFRSRTNDAVDDGWLCDRGRFGYEFIGSPDRLKTPLIRRDGRLVPASWQAAYRVVAENLQRIAAERGAGTIAGVVSPKLPNEDLFAFRRFMTEVVGSSNVDYWPRPELNLDTTDVEALAALDERLAPIDAIDRAKVIVIAGTDPGQRQPVMELRVRKALNKLGARLIEIGARDISLSEKASASVRCAGDQLAGIFRSMGVTGVAPPEWPQFETAQEVLRGGGPVIVLYEDELVDVPVEGRTDTLMALTAWIEDLAKTTEVGVIPVLAECNEMAARDFGLIARNQGGGPWGESVVSRMVAGDSAAAIIAGADVAGDDAAVAAAIDKLEFCVVTELTLTETASRADVVLPAAAFAERVGTFTNTSRRVQVFSAAVPAPGLARPDWQIMVELSQRWDDPLPYASPEAILADIAGTVPKYGNKLPTSYRQVSPSGIGIGSGQVVVTE